MTMLPPVCNEESEGRNRRRISSPGGRACPPSLQAEKELEDEVIPRGTTRAQISKISLDSTDRFCSIFVEVRMASKEYPDGSSKEVDKRSLDITERHPSIALFKGNIEKGFPPTDP